MRQLISGLLSDAAISSDYSASNGGLINELERTWKEAVVDEFEVLSKHLAEKAEENHKKPQNRSVPVEIRSCYVLNIIQNRFRF
jgi:hypothetical protein